MTLAETVADQLLQDVIEGRLVPHGPLPTEPELAARFDVSRLTVREAVRILRAQNVVRIRRGLGTEINPPERWTSLDAVVRASAGGAGGDASVARRLLEARRMIEVGAVQLAAERRTDADVADLRASIADMAAASDADDVDAVVEADIRFHQVVLRASQNVFVPMLFESFGPLLVTIRRRTSSVPEVRASALHHHEQILDAVLRGDPDAARLAMEAHLSPREAERAAGVDAGEDALPAGTPQAVTPGGAGADRA